MNFEEIIREVYLKIQPLEEKGQLPTYIPELRYVDPAKFGVCVSTLQNETYGIGDYQERFSIQSIAKVLSLSLAYSMLGGNIWNRVGVEPSGTSFNSLIQLELEHGIPRNPFINAGALVICDILLTHLSHPKEEFLEYVRSLANNPDLTYSDKIAASEKQAGYRNVALCNLIKSFDNIMNDPVDVLDFYFNLCSLEMSCEELSRTFLYLANDGYTLHDNKQILTKSQAKRTNALMQTCGFYDESGEFAFKVGLPGKSGVGGGIVAIHPLQYSIAVWSPCLNAKGNSYKGMLFLEAFTTRSELSIF